MSFGIPESPIESLSHDRNEWRSASDKEAPTVREQELTDAFSARRLDTEADSWYQSMYNVDVSNALLRYFRKGLRLCCAANFEFLLKNILQGQPFTHIGSCFTK